MSIIGCAVPRPETPVEAMVESGEMQDCLEAFQSDNPRVRSWALREIQDRFEARVSQGFEASASLRDEVVEPLTDLYLERFAPPGAAEQAFGDEERQLLETLWILGDPRAIPAAVAAVRLQSRRYASPRLRLATAIVHRAGVPESERPALVRFLRWGIRSAETGHFGYIAMLGEVPGREAREVLFSIVRAGISEQPGLDSPTREAIAALNQLALRAEPESMPLVVRALFATEPIRLERDGAEPELSVATAAVEAMGLFGPAAFETAMSLVNGTNEGAISAASMSESHCPIDWERWPCMNDAGFDAARYVSIVGYQVLGSLGDPRGRVSLLTGLAAEDEDRRWGAARGLVLLGRSGEVSAPVVALVRRRTGAPRWYIPQISVLGELGTDAARQALLSFRPAEEVLEADGERQEGWFWALRRYADSASQSELLALSNEQSAQRWLQERRGSVEQVLGEMCDVNLDCYMDTVERTLRGEGEYGVALRDLADKVQAVFYRFGIGNTALSLRLLSHLGRHSDYVDRFVYRLLVVIAADDDEVLGELERRAAGSQRTFASERLRRRLRVRRGLPVASLGEGDGALAVRGLVR